MTDPARNADYERTYQAYAHLFCRSCGRLGSHCSCVEYCDPACLEVNGGPCDTDGGGPCKDALTDGPVPWLPTETVTDSETFEELLNDGSIA